MLQSFLLSSILLIFVMLSTNSAFAIEKKNILLETNPGTINTIKNIDQAELMEKEVLVFKRNLEKLETLYSLKNDESIKNTYRDLDEIIYILRKIQTTKINKYTADNVIKIVITDLKSITFQIKSHLREVKESNERKIQKLQKLSLKMSNKLEKISNTFRSYINMNSPETNIDRELNKLNQRSLQLQKFGQVKFKSSKEAKDALLFIASSVRKTMVEIKRKL